MTSIHNAASKTQRAPVFNAESAEILRLFLFPSETTAKPLSHARTCHPLRFNGGSKGSTKMTANTQNNHLGTDEVRVSDSIAMISRAAAATARSVVITPASIRPMPIPIPAKAAMHITCGRTYAGLVAASLSVFIESVFILRDEGPYSADLAASDSEQREMPQ
jgi:hypothetical protein